VTSQKWDERQRDPRLCLTSQPDRAVAGEGVGRVACSETAGQFRRSTLGDVDRAHEAIRETGGNLYDSRSVRVAMYPSRLALLTLAAVVGVVLLPSADAKFRLAVTIEPARPVAGRPALIIMRTDIRLPRQHGIRLFVVGPWRRSTGQAAFEVGLVRIRPRMLRGSVRFPYPGRWHLSVPASPASPPVDRWVGVNPLRRER
jgi:hypothetical protein